MAGDLGFDALNRCYERLLSTCDALEALADALPGPLPADHCHALADATIRTVAQTHALENQLLLPMLAASTRRDVRVVSERLQQEQEFDQQAAAEIEEALTGLASGKATLSPDAVGYLLRSFFESVRRHVRAAQDLIMLIDQSPQDRSLH